MKRRVMLALLFLVSIAVGSLSYHLSYVSGLAGFLAAKWGGGKQEGTPGRVKSLIISWRKYQVHLHHWILASCTSFVCALQGFYIITPELFYGFLGGIIFQGIYCYSDWHKIISTVDKYQS